MKIMIAQPNLGQISTENVSTLLKWFGSERYELEWYAPARTRPHDRARNRCHKHFLESDCDYMFWLDAHTCPPANTLDRLLYHDKDMVAACVQTIKSTDKGHILAPLGFRWREDLNGYAPCYSACLTQVHIAPCAATLIKREVMEAVKRPAFSWGDIRDEWGIEGLSEDFFFAERVREAGFEIWMDYDLLCSHWQRIDVAVINQMLHRVAKEVKACQR